MAEPVFRKESLDRVSSPEQLNDYIRVSNPSLFVVLSAVVVLLIALLVWAVFGNLNTTFPVTGIAKNGTIVCYISDTSEVRRGMSVQIGESDGEIVSLSEQPQSREDIQSLYDDYTAYSLNLSEWNYAVTVSADDVPDGIAQAQIVVDSISPISFIMN